MNTESLYAGLNWTNFLSVILRVPVDQVTSANQRTIGNEGRKGISLLKCQSSGLERFGAGLLLPTNEVPTGCLKNCSTFD